MSNPSESKFVSFIHPLEQRYASKAMLYNFSPQHRAYTWRTIWITLAKGQMMLGLPISQNQIAQLESEKENIPFDRIRELEKELRHDVMAHIHAYGEQCPLARKIIHLGATSALVTDNADLLILKDALAIVRYRLSEVCKRLRNLAITYKSQPILGYTHFQPAQLTTFGKRVCLWLQDFILDHHELMHRLEGLPLLGLKGATGTQASFLHLFNNDHEKVAKLDEWFAETLGFNKLLLISGQVYTRKLDYQIVSLLSGIAQSASKCAVDLRLMQHEKEIQEPFGAKQVGSSAMPFKRNPILAERITGLARYLISITDTTAHTAANQWLERSLDDSANRRFSLSEAFLITDSILLLLAQIVEGMEVNPSIMDLHVQQELPFLALENLMMDLVKQGGDRQDTHEMLRQISLDAQNERLHNRPYDLVSNLITKAFLTLSEDQKRLFTDPSLHIGRSQEQVEEFLTLEVDPILKLENDIPYNPSFQMDPQSDLLV